MAFLTDTFTAHGSFAEKIGAMLTNARDAAAKRAVYNQTVRELSSLTNRELDDLGLNRSMIRHVAHEAAYGF